MKQLWTPWRMQYIQGSKELGCIFCQKPAEDRDEENLILYRTERVFVIMNRYPYNNGHLMIAPYRHIGSLSGLTVEELKDLGMALQRSEKALGALFHPEGYNIGINVGKVAGAGFADHLHVHIVPRYSGDTNFMAVIADTKTIPELLPTTYQRLLPYFQE